MELSTTREAARWFPSISWDPKVILKKCRLVCPVTSSLYSDFPSLKNQRTVPCITGHQVSRRTFGRSEYRPALPRANFLVASSHVVLDSLAVRPHDGQRHGDDDVCVETSSTVSVINSSPFILTGLISRVTVGKCALLQLGIWESDYL
jgi:hypothetical protein